MGKYHVEERSHAYVIFDSEANDGERPVVRISRYLPGPMLSLDGCAAGLYPPKLAQIVGQLMHRLASEIVETDNHEAIIAHDTVRGA